MPWPVLELGKDGIDPEGDYEVDEKRAAAPSSMKASLAEQMLGVADLFNLRIPGPTTSPTPSRPRSCL